MTEVSKATSLLGKSSLDPLDPFGQSHKGGRDEDRLKVIFIGEREIVRALWVGQGMLDCFTVGFRPELPTGYEIMRVWYEPHRRGFAFSIWHPSFEPVPKGCELPVLVDGCCETREAILVREADARYRIEWPCERRTAVAGSR